MGGIDEILSSLSEEDRAELAQRLLDQLSVEKPAKAGAHKKLPSAKNPGGARSSASQMPVNRKVCKTVAFEPPTGNKFDELGFNDECQDLIDKKLQKKKPKVKLLEVRNEKYAIDCVECGREQIVGQSLIMQNSDGTYSYTCNDCLNGKINGKSM